MWEKTSWSNKDGCCGTRGDLFCSALWHYLQQVMYVFSPRGSCNRQNSLVSWASLCLSLGFPKLTIRKLDRVNFQATNTAPWVFQECPLSGYQEAWECPRVSGRDFLACPSWGKGAGIVPATQGAENMSSSSSLTGLLSVSLGPGVIARVSEEK